MFFTNHTIGRLGNQVGKGYPWYYTHFDDVVLPAKHSDALDNALLAGTPYAHVRIDWGNFPDDEPCLCHIAPTEEQNYAGRIFLALFSEYHHDADGVLLGNSQVLTAQPDGIIRCKRVSLSDPWSDGVPNHAMFFIETIPGVNLRIIQTISNSEGIMHGANYFITSQSLGLVEGRAGPPFIFDKHGRAVPDKWSNVNNILHATQSG